MKGQFGTISFDKTRTCSWIFKYKGSIRDDMICGVIRSSICVWFQRNFMTTIRDLLVTCKGPFTMVIDIENEQGNQRNDQLCKFANFSKLRYDYVIYFNWSISVFQNAESFNFNPHKWLQVNFDCSAMWYVFLSLITRYTT